MSGNADREMTLDEWVGQLPGHHAAREELKALRAEKYNVRTVLRGHVPTCSALKAFLGTASEDPGCDCGFQVASAAGLGAEVYRAFVASTRGAHEHMRSRARDLAAYVQHRTDCATRTSFVSQDLKVTMQPCSCGLSDALRGVGAIEVRT